jgi:hypothetical protein
MMGGNTAPPDHLLNKLADPTNKAASGWLGSKGSDTKVEPAYVVEFIPAKMKARVVLVRAGAGSPNPILVDVRVHEQGSKPGTGEAFELRPGQLVDVQFLSGSATGLYNQGVIVGTRYTHQDQQAPYSATWTQNPTGRVFVSKDDKGEHGTTMHMDGEGNQNIIQQGDVRKQVMKGSEVAVLGGPSETRVEQVTRSAAKSFKLAAEKLS